MLSGLHSAGSGSLETKEDCTEFENEQNNQDGVTVIQIGFQKKNYVIAFKSEVVKTWLVDLKTSKNKF